MPKVHPACWFLKQERLRQGLTLIQLAVRCGMPAPQISQYENGGRQPGLTALTRWSAGLGLYIVFDKLSDPL